MKTSEIKDEVRRHYAEIARSGGSCCSPSTSCCGTSSDQETQLNNIGTALGYSDRDLTSVPDGANLGLGCGNPLALASIQTGERVLDLGSGAGFDCFLAAQRVGDRGRVIGVDMTSEMIEKGRENARRGGYSNVEFRQGEIENLPVEDGSIDIVISNCVINLSPDKNRVFKEAFRVLKPGGRFMVSDIVLTGTLPQSVLQSAEAYAACISGALRKDRYIAAIAEAGFKDIEILSEKPFDADFFEDTPDIESCCQETGLSDEDIMKMAGKIVSISVAAVKPI